ncbi:hypothetical protein [Vibrio metschnikovii]|uniref:Uncharacterized protein n=1 Tax=Vibrio metschnikovii TaxID=28172 RepID=A0A9X0RB71_VIBME|nr:hypothetical protein [Vibrio metschnikovii]MBC5851265.1 hypothetical protein [Vibrio metschnikovii]
MNSNYLTYGLYANNYQIAECRSIQDKFTKKLIGLDVFLVCFEYVLITSLLALISVHLMLFITLFNGDLLNLLSIASPNPAIIYGVALTAYLIFHLYKKHIKWTIASLKKEEIALLNLDK